MKSILDDLTQELVNDPPQLLPHESNTVDIVSSKVQDLAMANVNLNQLAPVWLKRT